MRVIVYGLGAIGCTVAAALAHAEEDVMGIARGAHLEAIRNNGVRLRAPWRRIAARMDCVSSPGEISWRPDDVVLLTMKSQDTQDALKALSRSGLKEQAIFCVQNGVANERMAAEQFPNVHGVTVMLPAQLIEPGRAASYVSPKLGIFDIGRYPSGSDDNDQKLAEVLNRANIAGFVLPDVMASKYGKLLMNLGNIIQAAVGPKVDSSALRKRVRREAEAVYQAAGISWKEVDGSDPRRKDLARFRKLWWAPYVGGSTTQSLLRGSKRVETDFLNGEIVRLAQNCGTTAPLNAALVSLGQELVERNATPGTMRVSEVEQRLIEIMSRTP